jgi:hypothetical protein
MIRTILVVGAFAQALLAQSTIFLPGDWEKAGIGIVSYDSSSAFQLLAQSLADPALSQSGVDIGGVLPYSFVLRNSLAHAIVAYSARWLTTDANGHVQTHDRVWANLETQSGGNVIAPNSDRLVMPLPQLAPSSSSTGMSTFLRAIDNIRQTFAKQAVITVSLEAAILDNGLALGSDSANVIPQITARMDAEREVSAGVMAAGQQGQTAVITYLQNLADGPKGSLIAASREKTPDLAYAGFFLSQRGDIARDYLVLARQNFAGLMLLAEAHVKKPRFVMYR